MSGSTQKAWVLLLNWKNLKDTIACMNSIFYCGDSEIAGIVLCDNGSNDGSIEAFKQWFREKKHDYSHLVLGSGSSFELIDSSLEKSNEFPVYLIENQSNLGFAGGNNVGIDFIQNNLEYDYIYLLNNDTEIQRGAVSSLVEKFQQTPSIGLCGSKVVYYSQPDKVQALGGADFNYVLGRAVNIGSMNSVTAFVDEDEVSRRLDYILGASTMISKACLAKVGKMEEGYFLYFEEIDWAERARRAGFDLGFADSSLVYHKEGATIGSSYDKGSRSSLSTYYMTNSRLRFMAKFYPVYLPIVFLFHFYQMLRFALKGNFLHSITMLKATLFIPFKKPQ